MRIKYRWYICQLELGPAAKAADSASSDGSVGASDVFNALRAQIVEAFGDTGFASLQTSLSVKNYSAVTGLCVIKGAAEQAQNLHAAIALLRTIRQRPCALRVLQICSQPRTLKPDVLELHKTLVGRMAASAAADSVELDPEFLAALDAEIASALS